jgi:hypothetical protein
LVLLKASWLGFGGSGIPPFVPDVFGPEFTAHLEAVVDREVATLTKKLERAHKHKLQRAGKMPADQALPLASRTSRLRRPRTGSH